jgi:hypothetical protein
MKYFFVPIVHEVQDFYLEAVHLLNRSPIAAETTIHRTRFTPATRPCCVTTKFHGFLLITLINSWPVFILKYVCACVYYILVHNVTQSSSPFLCKMSNVRLKIRFF